MNRESSEEPEMTLRKIPLTFLILVIGTSCAYARKEPKYGQTRKLTPEQAAVVQKAITRERALIQAIQQRTPLVETYIQDTEPDQRLYEVPIGDYYMLSRIDFSKGFFDQNYAPRSEAEKRGFFRGSLGAITDLTKALKLDTHFTYNPLGFTEMMFIDPSGFDTNHYVFNYVRREFLGSVRTWVFDVHPTAEVKGPGRFFGRIWIEDQDDNIVRFNGTYTSSRSPESSKYYFHFDSWRTEMQPGEWLPVAVYVEESQRTEGRGTEGLKAQTHFWGYSLKLPTRQSENVNVQVENAVDQSDNSQDVGPLQAQRLWIEQAEDNVIDRLVQAGLVAPLTQGGYEQKVLDQIVTNLVVPNNLAFTEPVKCRVLLLDTIEATTVGNTILLSKGLLDTLPNEESIASVIAMELAHIAMGHHIDTEYAFNDRLLFPDNAVFQRIDLNHTVTDDASAVPRAMQYLRNSMYKNELATAGLYYEQLADRAKALKALNTPMLGDSLLQADGVPWMSGLEHMAPAINWDNLSQVPAFPLGSWLKVNPWSDTVRMLDAKHYAPMNAREKMPFEVTPIYFRLQPYEASNTAPANPAAAQPTNGAESTAAPPTNGTAAASGQAPATVPQN
jgi:Peptidase family M48